MRLVDKCRKVRFGSEDFALQYLKKLKETSVRKVIPQDCYLCEKCLTWHLTSRSNIRDEFQEKIINYKRHIAALEAKILKYRRRLKEIK